MDARFLARPTQAQFDWQDMELGLFIHWMPMGWYDKIDESRAQDPAYQQELLSRVTCDTLDTDQWVQSAVDLGAKYIVFVAKHGLGFCRWATDAGGFGMKQAPYKDGQGDPLAELAESCRKRGIKLGVYCAGTSMFKGIADAGRASTTKEQNEYNHLYRQWLTELLSRYGDMVEVWFDGSLIIEVGDILAKYAPHAMIFQSKYATIRWVGQEEGYAADPAWNTLGRYDGLSGVAIQRHGDPDGDLWMPLECDARLRQSWGWEDDLEANKLRSVDELMAMYYGSVGHGALLLINQAPTPGGRIIDEDMAQMKAFGDEIRRRFGTPLAQGAGEGETVTLDLGGMRSVDHVILMEDTRGGERIRVYAVEGFDGQSWVRLSHGTAVGHKKIDYFAPAQVSAIRLRVLESVGTPLLRSIAAYDVGTTPTITWEKERGEFKIGDFGTEMYDLDTWTAHFAYALSAFLDDAGQYRVTFRHSRDRTPLRIDRAWLEINGVPMEDYVTQAGEYAYDVYIGGIGSKVTFHVDASSDTHPVLQGEVFIQRLA